MDYEATLRALEGKKEQAEKARAVQRTAYVSTYERVSDTREPVGEESDSESDISDIELDPMELEAYTLLQEAQKKISKLESRESTPNKIAGLILPSNDRIYKSEAILKKLKEIQVTNTQPWIEHMSISSVSQLEVADAQDDIQRELKFYEQALTTAQEGFIKLRQLGISPERPDDYFAEMVKTDYHMTRVKSKLLEDKNVVHKKEEARKQRKEKKFGKQIQVEKLREKIEQKKANMKVLKHWRKLHGGKGEEFDMNQFDEQVNEQQSNSMHEQKAKDMHNRKVTAKNSRKTAEKEFAQAKKHGLDQGGEKKKKGGAPVKRLGKSKRMRQTFKPKK